MSPSASKTNELAARDSAGIHVLLLWHADENALTVAVEDVRVAQAALDRERHARRRYRAAILAATESLLRAEQRFSELSASIDAHIQSACAALGARSALVLTPSRPMP